MIQSVLCQSRHQVVRHFTRHWCYAFMSHPGFQKLEVLSPYQSTFTYSKMAVTILLQRPSSTRKIDKEVY
jgi:hypothetical protein